MLLFCVLFLASMSLCVDSIKIGGSSILSVDHSIASRKDLIRDSSCLPELADDQENTVNKLGETWKQCEDTEANAKKELDADANKFQYQIAYIANDMCVRIDNDCRDQFALTQDLRGSLDCFAKMSKNSIPIVLNITEQSTLKMLAIENESHSLETAKKLCHINAGYDYVRNSGKNFENFIECEKPSQEISTTLTTSHSTTPFSTEGDSNN